MRAICRTRALASISSVAIALAAYAAAPDAFADSRKAIWVSAKEGHLGVNVVRDDGHVVSYFDVTGVKGARIIPGLENIVATTPQLALRRDGIVLTWKTKCGANPNNPADIEHEFCEFQAARPVPFLHGIVAIDEDDGCY